MSEIFNHRWPLASFLVFLLACSAPVHALDLKIATLAPDGTLWMKELRKEIGRAHV